MNIWMINHYAVPPALYPLARTTNFAKCLMEMGHTVTIFAASTVHNSSVNLISGKEKFREETVDGVRYVYVKTRSYAGNGKNRIVNMFEFARRLPGVCSRFERPDAVIASSATPPACMSGLKLAKKYGCVSVADITDLWPESFAALGLIKRGNPLLIPMYAYEKRMYKKADAIVFSMEGGRDYIMDKRWDRSHGGPVDLNKVYHIGNGVDLEKFRKDLLESDYSDCDLENEDLFKVVYTGSIRTANRVGELVNVAKALKEKKADNIKILIWGEGDRRDRISRDIDSEGLTNIVIKGGVPKTAIPGILSGSDLNIYLLADSPLYRYGHSLNKSFEYLASCRPILAGSASAYSVVDRYQCGVCLSKFSPEEMADEIIRFSEMPKEEYDKYCESASKAAENFDFKILTKKLINIISRQDVEHKDKDRLNILAIGYNDYRFSGRIRAMIRLADRLGDAVSVLHTGEDGAVKANGRYYHTGEGNMGFLSFVSLAKRTAKALPGIDILMVFDRRSSVPGYRIAKKYLPKFIVQDMAELYDIRKVKNFTGKAGCFFEHRMLKKADIVICANEARRDYMERHYDYGCKYLIYENSGWLEYSDEVDFAALERRFHPMLDNEKVKIVSTAGTSLERGTDRLVGCMPALRDTAALYLVGGGTDRDNDTVIGLIEELGVSDAVHVIGRLGQNELKYFLSRCDIGAVIYSKDDLNNIYCSSGKLYEYAYEGLPIAATDNEPLARLCTEKGIGASGPDLEDSIRTVISDYEYYKKNVLSFREEFSRQHLIEELGLKILDEMKR